MVLHADGSNSYQNMTLRALYNYVMKAITNRPATPCASLATKAVHDDSPKSPATRSRLSIVTPRISQQPDPATTTSSSSDAIGGAMRRVRSGSLSDPSALSVQHPLSERATAAACLPPPPPPLFAAGIVNETPPCSGTKHISLEASAAGVGIATAGSAASPSSAEQRVSFLSPVPGQMPPPLPSTGRRTATIGSGSGLPLCGSDSGIHPAGANALPQQQQHVTYRERLGGYLHPRDMRRLVTPFSSSNAPELMVRRHVMLLNVDPLRAIVLRDRLLVIVPTGADSILMSLQQRLRGGLDEVENEVFGEVVDLTEQGGGAVEEYAEVPLEAVAMDSPWNKGVKSGDLQKGDEFALDEDGPVAGDSGAPDPADSPASSMGHAGAETAEKESLNMSDQGGTGDNMSQTDRPDDKDGESSATSTERSSEYDMEADEWEDIEGKNWIEMPFELQAVDAVLSSASLMLASEACELERVVREATATLRGEKPEQHFGQSSWWRSWRESRWRSGRARPKPGEHAQERLRVQKDRVGEMESRVQGFVRAINLALDEDEDMALMNLSRLLTHPERFIQPVSQDILEEESDEPELILEGYLQQALSTVNALQLLKGQITSTEELITMVLDTVRNRLLYINTFLSLVTLCVTVGSFIGSIFGMNLLNGLEEDGDAFQQVVIGTCVGGFVMLVAMSYAFNMAMSVTKYAH